MSQHSSVVVLICTVVVAAMAPSPMVAELEPPPQSNWSDDQQV